MKLYQHNRTSLRYYVVSVNAQVKDSGSGKWHDAVIYLPLAEGTENSPLCCRTRESFDLKFTEVEIEP